MVRVGVIVRVSVWSYFCVRVGGVYVDFFSVPHAFSTQPPPVGVGAL